MKRTILILLSILMSLSFVACGNKDDTKEAAKNSIQVKGAKKEEQKTDVKEEKSEVQEVKEEVKDEEKKAANNVDNLIAKLESLKEKHAKSSGIIDATLAQVKDIVVDETSLTFKDDSGRESVTITKNPDRTAILYASLASMYEELGGRIDLIIGGKNAIELYKFQQGKDITEGKKIIVDTNAGKKWSVENIIAEKPELIICAPTSEGYITIKDACETAGIEVIAINYSGISEYMKWAFIFTELTDNQKAFEDVALKTFGDVLDIIDKVDESISPKVVSLMPNAKSLKANLDMSDLGTILVDLRAKNGIKGEVKKGASPRIDINVEDIYKADPDYIFIQCMSSEDYAREAVAKHCESSPVWHELRAVKEGRVYYLPKGLFHNRPNSKYKVAYQMIYDYLYGGK